MAVEKHLRQGTKTQSVPDEVLEKFGDQLTPKCVDWMTHGEHCKSEPFNSFALQIEIYLAKAPVGDEKADELRESLVLHGKSDRMRNQSDRREHLRQLRGSVDKEAYTFACGAMRKLLSDNPCAGCPVLQAKLEEVEDVTGIQVHAKGYFFPGPNGSSKQLTNFTLEPIACYLVDGQWDRIIESHDFDAFRQGQRLGRISVHRSDWNSVDAFKAAMDVVPSGMVKMTADQIMDLKRILTEGSDMESIVSVNEAGMHRHLEYKGSELAREGEVSVDTTVWVEPRWSINAWGIRGTHVLHHKSIQQVIELRTIEDATPEDTQCIDVFHKLITANRPEVVGTLLGWIGACNVKDRLMRMGNEFPLLHLFGPSEVGKTKTAQIFACLAGADYHTAPIVANSSTPFR